MENPTVQDQAKAPEPTTTPTQPPRILTTEKCEAPLGDTFAEILRGIVVVDKPSTDIDERVGRVRAERWSSLISKRGERYEDCRLSNFACVMPKQVTAIKKLREYADTVYEQIADGTGLLLYGSKGTGKDHLAVAVCRCAIYQGVDVLWVNGLDLFAKFRELIDHKTNTTESTLISFYVRAPLLYLSDPAPPTGTLTDYQQTILFRILDARYSRRAPAIVTVNCTNGKELEDRLGGQNADRIKDGALAIHCDWPSHRAVKA